MLLVARIAHIFGMPRPAPNALRVFDVGATWTLIAGLSAWVLWLRSR